VRIRLAYGRDGLEVDLPDGRTTVIEPSPAAGLEDERAAFDAALAQPIGAKPLLELLRPSDRVCIVFSDITRATPNERIIPWLLDALESGGARRENVTLLNGLGTHRPNSKEELERMLTPRVVADYRVINHEPRDPAELARVGVSRRGNEAWLNRHFVAADLRIVTGFIEPHFFAGFSGGPKGIMPGVAAQATIERNHGAASIGDPNATWGVTHGNPLWEELLEIAQMVAGRVFLINVTLDEARRITGVFAGGLVEAHRQGCAFVKRTAMQAVDAPFDVVVTSNSGYPLDQNLYQAVKGISAASRIVRDGGAIVAASECSDRKAAGGPFFELLKMRGSPEALLEVINAPGFSFPEQWTAHVLALILRKARVRVHSTLPDELVRSAQIEPCADIASTVRELLARSGAGARVAVLPQGPLTIPYVKEEIR